MNNKGGVAKTMSAFNIGILWANIGKKILFIDLDSQANLTNMVSSDDPRYESRKWDNTIEDAFVIGPRLNPLPILPSRYNNVDFVPADLKLSSFDVETSNITLKVYLLKDLIAPIKNNYDYIIIDCPPALGGIIMNAMVASDGIVFVEPVRIHAQGHLQPRSGRQGSEGIQGSWQRDSHKNRTGVGE